MHALHPKASASNPHADALAKSQPPTSGGAWLAKGQLSQKVRGSIAQFGTHQNFFAQRISPDACPLHPCGDTRLPSLMIPPPPLSHPQLFEGIFRMQHLHFGGPAQVLQQCINKLRHQGIADLITDFVERFHVRRDTIGHLNNMVAKLRLD